MTTQDLLLNSAAASKRFSYLVNGESFLNDDRRIDGEEILTQSGHDPADQHVLIRVMDRGTTSVGLDEKVDLTEARTFRAFPGDRIFRLTVEGRGYEWGESTIRESELRDIHRVPPDKVLTLDLPSGHVVVDDGASIDLDGTGSERLNVAKRSTVKIKVNGNPVTIARGFHTGAEIKAVAIAQGIAIQADFVLDLEGSEGGTLVIGDLDRTFVRGGERFGAVDNHEDS